MDKPGKFGKIRNLAKRLSKLQEGDWDAVVVVSGTEGVGKSTLAIDLARLVSKLNGIKFDYEDNMAYDAEEAIEKVQKIHNKGVMVLDEGMRLAWRRQWFDANQRHLIRLFSQIRSKNLCFFLCIPSFSHLETYFRLHRITYWLHVVKRGWVVGFKPNRMAGVKDPWGIDNIQRLINKNKLPTMSIDDPIQYIIKHHRKIPSFCGSFQFPKLPDFEKYKKISDERKLRGNHIEEVRTVKQIIRDKLKEINKKMREDGVPLKKRSSYITERDRTTLSHWDNDDV